LEETTAGANGRIFMVDVEAVAKRIMDAEKRGRKLSKKTIFQLCGYDRGVMREVFRKMRSMKEERRTLREWLK
jgi:hypothetical protein